MTILGRGLAAGTLVAVTLASCGGETVDVADTDVDLATLGADLMDFGGEREALPDGSPDPSAPDQAVRDGRGHLGATTDGAAPPATFEGLPLLTWQGMRLPDERLDDLLDSLIYPDEYTEEEATFPAHLTALDGKRIAVRGYMIPVDWEAGEVRQLMLVGDLLACCFGIAPEPDQWIDVTMIDGGADYFIQVPIVIKGTFRIEGIADEAGYSAGCYVFEAESLERTAWD